jgi:glycosyltransferase involved in cell wall biosynthesis
MDDRTGRHVVWQAYGLNDLTTGIERFVTSLADTLVRAMTLSPNELTVAVDATAEWPDELPAGVAVVRVERPRAIPRLLAAPRALTPQADVLHSFGPVCHPRLTSAASIYTIHDWGPLADRTMSVSARAAWSVAIVGSLLQKCLLHFYSEDVVANTPRLLRPLVARRQTFIAPPPVVAGVDVVSRAPARLVQSDRPFMLFVGTATGRKRLDLLARAAPLLRGADLVYAGEGTDTFDHTEGVIALGRVDQAQLEWLYEHCTALILVSEYEGFGLPVAEALARGRPCIVSEAVGLLHGGNAADQLLHVVDPATPENVALECNRLLSTRHKQPREPRTIEPSRFVSLYSTLLARSGTT